MTEQRLRIIEGSARDAQREIETESVQVAVCSPPYFNLRNYSTAGDVWDGDPTHEHEFPEYQLHASKHHGAYAEGSTVHWQNPVRGGAATTLEFQALQRQGFCACGAWKGELGAEPEPALYVDHLVQIFRETRRVLRPDGLLWLNIGDGYSGSGKGPGNKGLGSVDQDQRQGFHSTRTGSVPDGMKPKDLMGIPWDVARALRADGWWLRSAIIWHKPNPMPESMDDRTTSAYEHVFMLSKMESGYYYDGLNFREPAAGAGRKRVDRMGGNKYGAHNDSKHSDGSIFTGADDRNLHNVWTIATEAADWDYCQECRTFYRGQDRKRIRVEIQEDEERIEYCAVCGRHDRWVNHFAAFPRELPRRCIKLSTGADRNCSVCRAPYRRIIERTQPRKASEAQIRALRAQGVSRQTANLYTPGNKSEIKTVGWEPSCKGHERHGREYEHEPSIVLDPFLGTGTTALVAAQLGHKAIGVELRPEYAEVARRRFEVDQEPETVDAQGVIHRQSRMW